MLHVVQVVVIMKVVFMFKCYNVFIFKNQIQTNFFSFGFQNLLVNIDINIKN